MPANCRGRTGGEPGFPELAGWCQCQQGSRRCSLRFSPQVYTCIWLRRAQTDGIGCPCPCALWAARLPAQQPFTAGHGPAPCCVLPGPAECSKAAGGGAGHGAAGQGGQVRRLDGRLSPSLSCCRLPGCCWAFRGRGIAKDGTAHAPCPTVHFPSAGSGRRRWRSCSVTPRQLLPRAQVCARRPSALSHALSHTTLRLTVCLCAWPCCLPNPPCVV